MPSADAGLGGSDSLAEQVARINDDTLQPPDSEEAQDAPPKGGLFGKLMGRSKKSESPPAPDMAQMAPDAGSTGFPPPEMAPPSDMPVPQSDASFDAGFPEEGSDHALTDPARADPDLVAAAFGEQAPAENKPRKQLPVLGIGWGALALVVLAVLGMFALAPSATVSMLPGASHIYSMLGVSVGNDGLDFDGVSHDWTSDGQQTILEVQGRVRNTSSSTRPVPAVIIVLRDENGVEISEWQTEVGVAELAAGEETTFLRQIPSPPSNVSNLKVRFGKSN